MNYSTPIKTYAQRKAAMRHARIVAAIQALGQTKQASGIIADYLRANNAKFLVVLNGLPVDTYAGPAYAARSLIKRWGQFFLTPPKGIQTYTL